MPRLIEQLINVQLKNSSCGTVYKSAETKNSFVLNYPCEDPHVCTPYVMEIKPGIYRFECWGAIGGNWKNQTTPGLGAYTSGFLRVPSPKTFFVYVGTTGFFNGVKEIQNNAPDGVSGGATDVRLTYSDNWWDSKSLISRIMVAAGGGGAEWNVSVGGNGGGLTGGESISAMDPEKTTTHKKPCPGATQTGGSQCPQLYYSDVRYFDAVSGTFGSAGLTDPMETGNKEEDYGGFGGGGYYGGSSYPYAFAGSGGSSFISGHEGCDAVQEKTESIEHTNQSNHYSGFVFTNTKMISGNETMPLPTGLAVDGIHNGTGAFRITVINYLITPNHMIRFTLSLLLYSFVLLCE